MNFGGSGYFFCDVYDGDALPRPGGNGLYGIHWATASAVSAQPWASYGKSYYTLNGRVTCWNSFMTVS